MPADLTLDAIQADPLLSQAFLQEKGKADLRFFCRDILGFKDMNKEHDALCEFLQHDPARTKLMLMPRYTFKSSIITIGHSLWRLANDPNQRLLLYSDATEKAEGFLLGIKNHLLGLIQGSLFRTVYGPWETDAKLGVWNQNAIVISPRTQAAVEPSVDTAGLETSKVGKHYSRITFDDLVSDKNITTKDLMDKVASCYKKALSLLQPSGSVDLCGTRWHFGDLYGRLLAEYKGRPDFAVFHRKAYEGDHYFFQDIGKDSLTPQFLATKKATQGSSLFSMLYQNEPVDDETATFKVKDFRFYQPANNDTTKRWVASLYITAVLDAIPPPTSDHGDDAALTVVGTDSEHTMFLLDAVAGRLTPEQQLDEVFSLHQRWGFRAFGLETNAFQRMLRTALEARLKEARTSSTWRPFSIVEFQGVTQGNKEQRIQGLQPWHEQGHLRFPGTSVETLSGVWSQLAYQMLQFPRSAKDDLVDSLAYHLQLVQRGPTSEVKPDYPVTSAAWYEREMHTEEAHVMARRPRWTRKALPELSFS